MGYWTDRPIGQSLHLVIWSSVPWPKLLKGQDTYFVKTSNFRAFR